jgi:hypothetical protein
VNRKIFRFLCFVLTFLPSVSFGKTRQISVVPEKELLITDVSVILDARALDAGVWNFASMLKRLGPIGLDEGRFLKSWLSGWDQNDHINGYEQKTRKSAALTQLWSDFVHTPLRRIYSV